MKDKMRQDIKTGVLFNTFPKRFLECVIVAAIGLDYFPWTFLEMSIMDLFNFLIRLKYTNNSLFIDLILIYLKLSSGVP